MPLPDSFLQELVSRNPIEDVASSYVRTKQRGRTSVGLCPFHGEKTPSFNLYPETNSFYCFGCGAGGDVITFVKRIENLSYIDAVRFLSDRAGIKMPDDKTDDTISKLRMRILEANRDAARFFNQFMYSPEGKVGLEYYHSRGYNDQTIRRFGLGYTPDNYYALVNEMHKLGYKDDELVAAFLAYRSKKSPNKVYDIFRNRVIIPIIDVHGNVIAFGGRVLDDSKPKYLNTSDTLVYKKTNGLFALNFAKSSKDNTLILCEGYMDVIALHQAGFTNAVAALGTSFTGEHARLAARYANEVILVFDSDAAGQKGTQRAIALLRQTGMHIRVVSIPGGKDPDGFIKLYGADRFKLLLSRSANDIEYQLIELARLHPLDAPDGRVAYLREASILLSRLSSPIERDVYAGRLSAELSVSKDAILDQVERYKKSDIKQFKKLELSQAVRNSENMVKKINPQAGTKIRAAHAEEGLLGLLILHPDYINAVSQRLSPDTMITDFNRELYKFLLKRHEQGLIIELVFLSAEYDEDEMAYISRMVQNARESTHSPEQAVEYVDVIQNEHKLSGLNDPNQLSDDEIIKMLDTMRAQKK
ncbi:MAG: DNA primase [Oscillospiraceae bacterium]|nr:DNA primase [Oscillospiraceae bacterium]MDD3832803.1 DNA primase [Oscillospiraceae bacterium]MDD4546560.1 DNA primase [Oscillospiraceae bacterium]